MHEIESEHERPLSFMLPISVPGRTVGALSAWRVASQSVYLLPFAPMTNAQSPATKADVAELQTNLRQEIQQLDRKIDQFRDEMISQFKVLAENLKKDFRD